MVIMVGAVILRSIRSEVQIERHHLRQSGVSLHRSTRSLPKQHVENKNDYFSFFTSGWFC